MSKHRQGSDITGHNRGPGDLCAMRACVHASARLAFIMLSFWALRHYLAVHLWLKGYGYQHKDTLGSKKWRSSLEDYLQLKMIIESVNLPQHGIASI